MVAALAAQAVDAAKPISLNGFVVSAKPVAIPLENKLYQMAKMIGILKRAGYAWQGDAEMIGDEITAKNVKEAKKAAVLTEVGYVRLGDLHVACIPGEIYPEHVYGKVQDPVDPGADYPDAPAEKSILESLPGDKVLIVGLANDEIGYILPLRQWDEKAPFCYGRNGDQYGEENSVGPQAAPIIYGALDRRVQEAK
jgi:hypothetical protein